MSCVICLFGLHIKPATILQILEKTEKEKEIIWLLDARC